MILAPERGGRYEDHDGFRGNFTRGLILLDYHRY